MAGGEPDALRITFDIQMPCLQNYWFADIAIDNMDPKTVGLITQGAEVSLSAGYQAGVISEIWRGIVPQPMWERADVVDFRITLRCVVSQLAKAQINGTIAAGATQWEIVQRMCAAATPPVPIAHLDPQSAFTGQTLARGKTVFGAKRMP
jgi:hypothetical protein